MSVEKNQICDQNQESSIPFENIPIYKLIILSLFSFGIYNLVWFYNNWLIIEKNKGKKQYGTIVCNDKSYIWDGYLLWPL